jgi:hypothetical protein
MRTVTAGETDVLQVGRVYHDPAVPELVCRYPNEPIVKVQQRGEREVTVDLDGRPVRLAVRNPELARIGRQYLLLRDGDDRGLWLLIEPGDTQD